MIGLWPAELSSANFATALSGNCHRARAARCFTDNSELTVRFELGPRLTEAAFASLFRSYDTTHLDVVHIPAHRPHVDISYMTSTLKDHSASERVIGLAVCKKWKGHRCDHWHVYFDGQQLRWHSKAELKSVACHETGHAVGLTHPEYESHNRKPSHPMFGCMLTNAEPPSLGEHNVAHINRFYR